MYSEKQIKGSRILREPLMIIKTIFFPFDYICIYIFPNFFVIGVKIEPKDATGETVEPFIYNGTTYLPVRAI